VECRSGLRDHAFIGPLSYTFSRIYARVSAAEQMLA
jgi:hypothetical protein